MTMVGNIYITYFEIYFYVGLAALVRYYFAEMQNVCRLCYTLTVKCSFSMSCTDFYLFGKLMTALLTVYR